MLPLILAGPILRRVDATTCAVWMALSRPAELELKVWQGQQMAGAVGAVMSNDAPVATGKAKTRAIGRNLHVAVVAIDLKPPTMSFQPGRVHSYDVVIDGTRSLKSEKLLRDEKDGLRIDDVDPAAPFHLALGYVEDGLPSFVTPPAELDGLRIAHASCRKASYSGPDAMTWLDDWIAEKRVAAPLERPQQLYLTGDQIYGDDVATSLLPMLTKLGTDLIGVENFPYEGTAVTELNGDTFPPLRRARFVREAARMSSTDAKNHLLGFGEYSAMYLAAWSSRAWFPLGADEAMFSEGTHPDTQAYLTRWETCHGGDTAAWKIAAKKQHEEGGDREATEAFRAAVPKVARALANCPTYMIWDDHEVTDDWNLSGRWITRVYANPVGQQIVRNAMLAYAVFQGWGNDPLAFDTGNNKAVLDEAEGFAAAPGLYRAMPGAIDELFGFPGADDAKRAKWHYRVDGPRHSTIVLDTRTRRDTGGAASTRAPKLLGGSLNEQVPAGPLTDGRELLVVVSGAPVLGPTLFDRTLQPLASIATDANNVRKKLLADRADDPCRSMKLQLALTDGDMANDLEGWGADEVAQEELLKRLATYPRVVILSGDVHFSCTLDMEYWRKPKTGQPVEPSRIVQLTCSGARNGWPLAAESQFRKNTVFQDLLRGVLVERVAWEKEAPITLPTGVAIGPGRRARMKRSPALLPVIGWPAGTTITEEPDWRWRLRLVRDARPPTPGGPFEPPPLSGDPDAGGFDGYVAVLQRHQLATMQKPRLLRTLNFLSSVGLVSIGGGGGELTHTLLTAATPDGQDYAAGTVHVVGLGPTGAAQPVLRTS